MPSGAVANAADGFVSFLARAAAAAAPDCGWKASNFSALE
jgi:hypothetical protein